MRHQFLPQFFLSPALLFEAPHNADNLCKICALTMQLPAARARSFPTRIYRRARCTAKSGTFFDTRKNSFFTRTVFRRMLGRSRGVK
jgi:hypothetical protein